MQRIGIPTRDALLKMSSDSDRYNRLLAFLVFDKLGDEDASKVVNLILSTCGSRHVLRTLAAWMEHHRGCVYYLDWLYVLVRCLPKPSYHMLLSCESPPEMDIFIELGYDPWRGVGNWSDAGETLLSCFLSDQIGARFDCVCYLLSMSQGLSGELDTVAYDYGLNGMVGNDHADALTLFICNWGGVTNHLVGLAVTNRILESNISSSSCETALGVMVCRRWIMCTISVEQTYLVDNIILNA